MGVSLSPPGADGTSLVVLNRKVQAQIPPIAKTCTRLLGVRSRQCQGFPRNPGRFHPESGLSPSLDQLGAIEREASFL